MDLCMEHTPDMSSWPIDSRPVTFEVDVEGLSLVVIPVSSLTVRQSQPDFERFEQSIFAEIRKKTRSEDIRDDPVFRAYRDLYWRFGMDPTKTRVSSEALVRRIVVGEDLWRISDLVDVVNLASAYHKIPIGLVDVSQIVGQLRVRTARVGEVFRRIGGSEIVCRGREIVLADDLKIVCFGYASYDSDLTRVTNKTRNVLVILYGAPGVESVMSSAVDVTLQMLSRWLSCTVGEPRVYRR